MSGEERFSLRLAASKFNWSGAAVRCRER